MLTIVHNNSIFLERIMERIMKKLDNFSKCLDSLKRADFDKAREDEIYRMGVLCKFNLTFELAWKALQAVLRLHGAEGAETGSPREIFYSLAISSDSLMMLPFGCSCSKSAIPRCIFMTNTKRTKWCF